MTWRTCYHRADAPSFCIRKTTSSAGGSKKLLALHSPRPSGSLPQRGRGTTGNPKDFSGG